jgi:hypothetical protein
VVVLKNIVPK